MKCPGQDTRYWKPGDVYEIECPKCGNIMEFFKDEPSLRCKKCKHRVVNPKMDFGCAAYCKFADQCLGELPPELLAQRKELLKDRVAIEMKRYFHGDFEKIGHASKVARYAKQIAVEEKGNVAVALCAAYLHDVGRKETGGETRTGEKGSHEEKGVPIAREILERLDADPEMVDEVCNIIAHHHKPRPEETVNFKAVYDGDQLVCMEKRMKDSAMSGEEVAAEMEKTFLTEAGRKIAEKILLNDKKS